jgi:biotin operon repressor
MSGFPLAQRWRLLHNIITDPRLSATARLVAARLLDHMNCRHRECFPSGTTIANALGCSRNSVVTGIKELRNAGWVLTEKDGRGLIYRFNEARLPADDELQPTSRPSPRPPESAQMPPATSPKPGQVADTTCQNIGIGPAQNLDSNQRGSNQRKNPHPSLLASLVEKDEAEKPSSGPPDYKALAFQDLPVLAKMAGCSVSRARQRIAAMAQGKQGRGWAAVHVALQETIKAGPYGDPFDYAQAVLTKPKSQRTEWVP